MPTTPAGRRRTRIRFERQIEENEALGGTRPAGWAPIAAALAAVRYGTSQERREAGAEGASQMATFRVLSTAKLRGVTPTDRIAFGGNWNITGIAAVLGAPSEIEFTAVLQKG